MEIAKLETSHGQSLEFARARLVGRKRDHGESVHILVVVIDPMASSKSITDVSLQDPPPTLIATTESGDAYMLARVRFANPPAAIGVFEATIQRVYPIEGRVVDQLRSLYSSRRQRSRD